MPEVRIIHYDPGAAESVAARSALREPLVALARGRDRGTLANTDLDHFNAAVEEITRQVHDDEEVGVRLLVELLLAVDHALEHLAPTLGVSNEAAVRRLLHD